MNSRSVNLSPLDLVLLRWLAAHADATVAEIAQGCGTTVAGVRALLVYLERENFIVEDLNGVVPPVRVYAVTPEGRAACGL